MFSQKISLVVLVCVTTSALTSAFDLHTTLWEKAQNVNTSLLTAVTSAVSVTECAAACLQRQGCDRYCHDVTNEQCYVMDDALSVAQNLTGTPECYALVPAWCPVYGRGYTWMLGHCLRLYKGFEDYNTATGRCDTDGGRLYDLKQVSMLDPISIDLYKQLLEQEGVDSQLWVGARDVNNNEGYVWSDGTTVLPLQWSQGEPFKAGECGAAMPNGLLKVVDCAVKMGFICEVTQDI